jgi:hypothetical protein
LLQAGRIAFDGATEEALTAARLSAAFGGPIHIERSSGYYFLTVAGER